MAGWICPDSYEAATRQVASLARFSSAIGRDIPAAQPASRLWLSGSRVMSLRDTSSAAGVLDAWTPLGPGNIGGRTRVVKFHPAVPTTLFAAGVSGGIWKSDDNGTTWRPTGDGLTNIAVNSLLIDPARPDVMYAGTGEGYFREEIRGTGLPLRGSGIYVTTDGARSWQQLPATNTPDFHWVNDLEFGVNDSRRIYAATRSGVWRSTDSGATWARLLAVNVRGGCLDLALRPDRSEDVLFASCGSYEQATVYRFPRAADRSDAEVVLREPDMGRTSLAIAPSNPDVMYALAASNVPGPQGIYEQGLLAVYRSDRGGTAGSWETRVNNQRPDVPQHHAADQHRERGGARLQSAGLNRDAGDDGVVQQRDRRRSARSRIASGRPASTGSARMTADETGAWRAWLGPAAAVVHAMPISTPSPSIRSTTARAIRSR